MFTWLTPFSNIFVLFISAESLFGGGEGSFSLFAIGQGDIDIVHSAHDLEKHFDHKKSFLRHSHGWQHLSIFCLLLGLP